MYKKIEIRNLGSLTEGDIEISELVTVRKDTPWGGEGDINPQETECLHVPFGHGAMVTDGRVDKAIFLTPQKLLEGCTRRAGPAGTGGGDVA